MRKPFDQTARPKPARRGKGTLQRKSNDPIRAGILVFLVLFLVLASIATFTGGVLVAPTNTKISGALLMAFMGTLRMAYSVVKILLGV